MTEPNGSTPTIGSPVKAIPPNRAGWGRHAEIWTAVAALADGELLPVTFDTPLQAQRFRAGQTRTLVRREWQVKVRGNVAYIGKREAAR